METVDADTLAVHTLDPGCMGILYMGALQQIAGWYCNNRLPQMRVLVVLHSSSSSVAFELVARWRGSGELGLHGETAVPGGVDEGSVLSFRKVYGDTNEEGESGNYADSWMRTCML